MLVMKFGGTSVGSAQRLRNVAAIVEANLGQPMVVVVSAMSGTTNALIQGARDAAAGRLGDYPIVREQLSTKHRECILDVLRPGADRDQVLAEVQQRLENFERLCFSMATLGELTMRGHDAVASIGEELSSRVLAALLRQRGIAAEQVSTTQLVVTDDHYGEAKPDLAATRERCQEHLLPILAEDQVAVVTGYVGATPERVRTTLGRGGSDYTAAIMGVSLDADEVWIWTDVDGILTADPKLVQDAHTLPELSYTEAEELAYFGADVLHPKTVKPLAERGIPLRILNSYEPQQAGTLIVSEPSDQRTILPAIISTEGLSLVQVAGNGGRWGLDMASRALQSLATAGVDVFMFSQSFSEQSLNLVVRTRDHEHIAAVLRGEFAREMEYERFASVAAHTEVAALSVVGMPDADGIPIAERAFGALGKVGVRVVSVAQAASAYSVSFIVAEQDVRRAVPFIHRELGL